MNFSPCTPEKVSCQLGVGRSSPGDLCSSLAGVLFTPSVASCQEPSLCSLGQWVVTELIHLKGSCLQTDGAATWLPSLGNPRSYTSISSLYHIKQCEYTFNTGSIWSLPCLLLDYKLVRTGTMYSYLWVISGICGASKVGAEESEQKDSVWDAPSCLFRAIPSARICQPSLCTISLQLSSQNLAFPHMLILPLFYYFDLNPFKAIPFAYFREHILYIVTNSCSNIPDYFSLPDFINLLHKENWTTIYIKVIYHPPGEVWWSNSKTSKWKILKDIALIYKQIGWCGVFGLQLHYFLIDDEYFQKRPAILILTNAYYLTVWKK